MELMQLGIRIRGMRISKGITQEELAHLCETDKARISKLETGKTNPSYLSLVTISKALDVDPGQFFDIKLEYYIKK